MFLSAFLPPFLPSLFPSMPPSLSPSSLPTPHSLEPDPPSVQKDLSPTILGTPLLAPLAPSEKTPAAPDALGRLWGLHGGFPPASWMGSHPRLLEKCAGFLWKHLAPSSSQVQSDLLHPLPSVQAQPTPLTTLITHRRHLPSGRPQPVLVFWTLLLNSLPPLRRQVSPLHQFTPSPQRFNGFQAKAII